MVWTYLFDGPTVTFNAQLLLQMKRKRNKKVQKTLEENAELCSAVDVTGASLLHYAAEFGNEDIARYLIKSGSTVNLQRQDGNSPLLLATKGQQLSSIKALLESEADVDARDIEGSSALELGVRASPVNLEMSKLFVEQAQAECSSDHWRMAKRLLEAECPIYVAAFLAHTHVLRCMLAEGRTIDEREPASGRTLLHMAVERGNWALLNLALVLGADANARDAEGKTPLALLRDFDELTTAMLAIRVLGASSHSCDNSGSKQMRWIVENGPSEAVELLLSAKWRLAEATDGRGRNAVHYLARNLDPHAAGLLVDRDLLADRELYDVNQRDEDGLTPLHYAALAGNTYMLELLLVRGSNANAVSHRGLTPIWQSVDGASEGTLQDRASCLKVLLVNRAYPDLGMDRYFERPELESVLERDLELLRIIVAALATMRAMRIPMNQDVFRHIEAHPKLNDYLQLCVGEIDRMKRHVYFGVSLFDIFADTEVYRRANKSSILFNSAFPIIKLKALDFKTVPLFNTFLLKRLDDSELHKSLMYTVLNFGIIQVVLIAAVFHLVFMKVKREEW